jgi:putative ribosome biogenesis GTPase RsgA
MGQTGVGKSSFINSFLNVDEEKRSGEGNGREAFTKDCIYYEIPNS